MSLASSWEGCEMEMGGSIRKEGVTLALAVAFSLGTGVEGELGPLSTSSPGTLPSCSAFTSDFLRERAEAARLNLASWSPPGILRRKSITPW